MAAKSAAAQFERLDNKILRLIEKHKDHKGNIWEVPEIAALSKVRDRLVQVLLKADVRKAKMKAKRSAAQKAATKRMIAANKKSRREKADRVHFYSLGNGDKRKAANALRLHRLRNK